MSSFEIALHFLYKAISELDIETICILVSLKQLLQANTKYVKEREILH